jgi:hypothetical protein
MDSNSFHASRPPWPSAQIPGCHSRWLLLLAAGHLFKNFRTSVENSAEYWNRKVRGAPLEYGVAGVAGGGLVGGVRLPAS